MSFGFTPCPDCHGSGGEVAVCPFCHDIADLVPRAADGSPGKCMFCQGTGKRKGCMTCLGMGHLPAEVVGEIERKRRAEKENPGS